ncbi:MAG: DUF2066 domain-containing protein [Hyphomicrobiales bacterium]|nr:DUF2066 domain-containing protein [Hyphomicrobiales bacterium]
MKHLFILAALIAPAPLSAQSAGSIYTVSKVAVRAEAADAVEAKQIAIAEGQKRALASLMKRLTGFRAHSRLPELDDASIERMIDGMQVRQERSSGTVYIAHLDYNFRPAAVKDVLNRFGLAYIAERAPEILVLPVFIADGAVQAGPNPWAQALSSLDLSNALTPVRLVQPRPDLTLEAVKAAQSSAQGMEPINYQYRAEYLVLAVAEMDAGGALTVSLSGRDAAGGLSLRRTFKTGDEGAVAVGAKISLGVFENRWKLRRLASQGALDAGGQDIALVELTAEFTGLKEWRVIKDRLEKLPGVQGLDVKAVNPRGATIALDFPGGGQRLAKAAPSYGLTLEGGEGAWRLRAR